MNNMKRLVLIYIMQITFGTFSESFRIVPNASVYPKEDAVDPDNKTLDNHRERRAITTNQRQNCNTWSPWINDHHPTDADPGDRELVTKQEMDIFCPPAYGGYVKDTDIKCTDEKGEEFYGNHTGPNSEHFITCFQAHVGAICDFYKAEYLHCPDLQMKYFCSCSDTYSTPLSTKTSTEIKPTQSGKSSSSFETSNNSNDEDTGDKLMPYWLIDILVAVILFIISICTTIILYTRLRKQLNNNVNGTRVHPTTDDKQVVKTKFNGKSKVEVW